MTVVDHPHICIVAPVYKTADYIQEFYERIKASVLDITDRYEIILVNDASPDDAMEKMIAIHKSDPNVRIIDLARNFGQHHAIFAGIEAAKGDYVFVIDADLEENPEWLKTYYDHIQKDDVDVVYGYQKSRKGRFIEKLTGALSFYVINRIFGVPNRKNVVTATLMSHSFADNLLQNKEYKVVFSVLCYLTGHESTALTVEKQSRGRSSYKLSKRMAHFLDYMVAVTDKPLIWPIYMGIFIGITGLIALLNAYLGLNSPHFYDKLFIAITTLFSGMILACLGTIGLYVSNILANVRQRPRAIIKKHYTSRYSL